jgi:hypothetical protein
MLQLKLCGGGEDTTFQREKKRGDWKTEKNSFNL